MSKTGFTPKITIHHGTVQGYGGPGFDWTSGVYNNRRLWEFKGGEGQIAIQGERERVKWERRWPSEEAFLAAIRHKKLDSPLCSNCGDPTGDGGSSCLDRIWCSRTACREALELARREYHKAQEQRKLDDTERSERERLEDIHKVDELTKCFHLRDGWYFRREEDGSVRIMHRECPTSQWLAVDVTIPSDGWASIVCSVSSAGETAERWEAARKFHGKVQPAGEPK